MTNENESTENETENVMTGQDVLEMMEHVITGSQWGYKLTENLLVGNDVEEFVIETRHDNGECHSEAFLKSPEMARNLAGMLVTWANQRDGLNPTPDEMKAAMRLFGWNIRDDK